MKNAQLRKFTLVSVLILSTAAPVQADSDKTEIEALKQQVSALLQRVESLEALKPTFTTFMPEFAERFHVMHQAGEAGDWAVAGHELSEMRRMASVSNYIDPEKSKLLESMLDPSLDTLNEAIEAGDHDTFEASMGSTIKACNACHIASQSPFIQVTLDAGDAVSVRHPHVFSKSKLAHGHTHGGEAMMGGGDSHGMEEMGHADDEEHHHKPGEEEHHD